MSEPTVQENTRRARRPFALAMLLMVLTFGIVFAAMLAHQLLIRQHRLMIMHAHQGTEMRLGGPQAEQCPALSGRVPYHHAPGDGLTVRGPAAPGCLPLGRWI